MPVNCCVKQCSNHSLNTENCSFYRFPQLRNRTPKSKNLSEERRRLWLAAINRKHLNTKVARVCSKHFITGKNAKFWDNLNPDWVPSLHMGYKTSKKPELEARRFARQRRRDANKVIQGLQETECTVPVRVENVQVEVQVISEEEAFSEIEYLDEYLEEINEVENPTHCSIGTQTDLTMMDIAMLQSEKQKRDLLLAQKHSKIVDLEKEIEKSKMGVQFFEENDDKCRYFTGLSHYKTLMTIYEAILENIPNCFRKGLNKFQVLILTLIKLRLDLPFTLLGYMFGISTSTASKKFHDCVIVLGLELSAFISWPSKDVRLHYTPEYYKHIFGNKLAVIIDCYEIRIEKSGQPIARAATYSSYKHTETVKYLIGIAPSGAIVYTSNGYGGRCSDKFIAENSDFLNYLEPQDIVLSDRGFLIHEAVRSKGAELKMPAFMEGKLQLDPFAVEDSKNLAHLRIHIERVIGTLRQKYLILSNTQPLTAISKKNSTGDMYMDAIVRTCCALVNLSPSVVPSTITSVDLDLDLDLDLD